VLDDHVDPDHHPARAKKQNNRVNPMAPDCV
jgi:hypothetical protein